MTEHLKHGDERERYLYEDSSVNAVHTVVRREEALRLAYCSALHAIGEPPALSTEEIEKNVNALAQQRLKELLRQEGGQPAEESDVEIIRAHPQLGDIKNPDMLKDQILKIIFPLAVHEPMLQRLQDERETRHRRQRIDGELSLIALLGMDAVYPRRFDHLGSH